MIIKCTSCGTQAKIPDSKEGAKVKCPSCSHIYVARPAGARGAKRGQDHSSKYIVAGGVAFGVAVIAILASRGGSEAAETNSGPKAPPVKEEVAVYVDPLSWEGTAATFARSLHTAAHAGNESKLSASLDPKGAYEYVPIAEVAGDVLAPPPKAAEMEGGNEGAADDATDSAEEAAAPAARPAWTDLDESGRLDFKKQLVTEATASLDDDGPVRDWEPYDGSVVFDDDEIAVVRLRVVNRNPKEGLADRWTQWTLKNSDGVGGTTDKWRWIHVERWVTPEEAADSRRGGRVRAEKKVLSDGSRVYESTIRAIPFDSDVPPERAAELTQLVEDLVADIDDRKAVRNSNEELRSAGKPAIAPLLTKLASIAGTMSMVDEENETDRIRLNFINEALSDITGHNTTFTVSAQLGLTEERLNSGLKQWFGWYDLKYRRFKTDDDEVLVDPLAEKPEPRKLKK